MSEQEPLTPDFIPEECRDCPWVEAGVAKWRQVHDMQDKIINSRINVSFAEKVSMTPDEVIESIGEIVGKEFNPSITRDREQAIRINEQNTDDIYQEFSTIANWIEQALKHATSTCAGMQKVRIPRKNGSKLLMRYCPVEADQLHDDHEHTVRTFMRREK